MLFNSQRDFLIKILGILFLTTSVYRINIKEQREEELKNFGLPENFDYLIIIIEFLIGYSLLFLPKYEKITLQILLIFIICACVLILIRKMPKLLNEFDFVFTFQPTFMSWVLHLTYLMIVISLLI